MERYVNYGEPRLGRSYVGTGNSASYEAVAGNVVWLRPGTQTRRSSGEGRSDDAISGDAVSDSAIIIIIIILKFNSSGLDSNSFRDDASTTDVYAFVERHLVPLHLRNVGPSRRLVGQVIRDNGTRGQYGRVHHPLR